MSTCLYYVCDYALASSREALRQVSIQQQWNNVEPIKSSKITIIHKAKSWAITDARIVGRCFTHGMCNTKAIASVQNVVLKWE
jgi:hypothetical protein